MNTFLFISYPGIIKNTNLSDSWDIITCWNFNLSTVLILAAVMWQKPAPHKKAKVTNDSDLHNGAGIGQTLKGCCRLC